MKNKFYSFVVGILILILFVFSYFVKEDSIEFQLMIYGFIFAVIVVGLLFIFTIEKIAHKQFKKTDLFLISLFLSLIEEGISLMLSFFLVFGIIASFSLNLDTRPLINLLGYIAITIFNHSVYRHKTLVGIFAIIGTLFLFAGAFLTALNDSCFFLLGLAGLLYSPAMFRVFFLEIPNEMNR